MEPSEEQGLEDVEESEPEMHTARDHYAVDPEVVEEVVAAAADVPISAEEALPVAEGAASQEAVEPEESIQSAVTAPDELPQEQAVPAIAAVAGGSSVAEPIGAEDPEEPAAAAVAEEPEVKEAAEASVVDSVALAGDGGEGEEQGATEDKMAAVSRQLSRLSIPEAADDGDDGDDSAAAAAAPVGLEELPSTATPGKANFLAVGAARPAPSCWLRLAPAQLHGQLPRAPGLPAAMRYMPAFQASAGHADVTLPLPALPPAVSRALPGAVRAPGRRPGGGGVAPARGLLPAQQERQPGSAQDQGAGGGCCRQPGRGWLWEGTPGCFSCSSLGDRFRREVQGRMRLASIQVLIPGMPHPSVPGVKGC